MMKSLLALAVFVAACNAARLRPQDLPAIPENGKLWVVLAAGSDGWYNYRHQADVCHAYQVVRSHGVPDEQIIVFMNDDIAFNSNNPTPGKIINKPNGPDVYANVPKDYTGYDVRPENFLDVLAGKKMSVGSGKTLESGPNDHIFVFYSDHGSPGLVSFVNGVLRAKDLNKVISEMHTNQQYSKMVFYIEACEAGSMFKDLLPDNINVYATTATNELVSSYACYYDSARGTYLGDEYSVAWMEYSDVEDLNQRDLDHQFEVVKKNTPNSPVCRYGDMSYLNYAVGEFQGSNKSPAKNVDSSSPKDSVLSYEVPRAILEHKIREAKTKSQREAYTHELRTLMANRNIMTDITRHIVNKVTNNEKITDEVMNSKKALTQHDCYYPAVTAYHETCFNLNCNDYGMRQMYAFVNLCEAGYESSDIVNAINAECTGRAQVCGVF